MIIQTIGLHPSEAVLTDEASNVSRPDPSGAIQTDAEHLSRNRKVAGSNPSRRTILVATGVMATLGQMG
jgi:hypothetical protein